MRSSLAATPITRHIVCTLDCFRCALMHWYVERTRLALSFVDISIGLRGYSGCQAVHKTLGTPEPFVCLSADIPLSSPPGAAAPE